MRVIRLDCAKPGMVIARDVLSADGAALLRSGVELTDRLIQRLQEIGIWHTYIDDPRMRDVEVRDVVSEESRIEAAHAIAEAAGEMKIGRETTAGQVRGTRQSIHKIVDELCDSKHKLVESLDAKTFDDYAFRHGVNVAVLSTLIGLDLGYDEITLSKLALGAALHDIGRCMVPADILSKPGPLEPDEMEVVKRHTLYGFQILKEDYTLSPLSVNVALTHHERIDGRGYPKGLRSDRVHEFAHIAAVADVYDALTSDRPWRPAYLPHEALQYMHSQAGRSLHPRYVRILMKHVAPYMPAFAVKLTSGEVAVVKRVEPSAIERPLVKVLRDPFGKELTEPTEVDLSQKRNICIADVLPDLDAIYELRKSA